MTEVSWAGEVDGCRHRWAPGALFGSQASDLLCGAPLRCGRLGSGLDGGGRVDPVDWRGGFWPELGFPPRQRDDTASDLVGLESRRWSRRQHPPTDPCPSLGECRVREPSAVAVRQATASHDFREFAQIEAAAWICRVKRREVFLHPEFDAAVLDTNLGNRLFEAGWACHARLTTSFAVRHKRAVVFQYAQNRNGDF
ncbi:hypothetical protein Y590_18215 [Methylobacterium sp. AMS5]|nr:hypothetical protein Y590_18215 [Methylobacterium sp. AMS5]